ncbi:MAG TPA: alpha-amylase, partial [Prolixibacteraceae bacterium]|nr:alpha-amylase [Prolixibacteraceae bacterium]
MKKVVYIFIVLLLWGCNSSPKKQGESAKIDSTEVVSQAYFPEWSHDAVIYEVNVRQFTPEGTFEAFSEHLPRLKELGVEILWFMPIYPI